LADVTLVETRIISGTGLLRVPTTVVKPRYVRLDIDVIREVLQPWNSYKYTPARSRYATLCFMRSGYVVAEDTVDFKKRSFDFIVDPIGQTLIAVKCSYEGILQTFFNLGNALSLPSISITNLIKDYENLNLLWDEVQITCEGTTAIQARLFWMPYDACNADANDERKPTPPPASLPSVPPGTAIGDISNPYPGDTVTNRSPLDTYQDPNTYPIGGNCAVYRMDTTVRRKSTINGAESNFAYSFWVRAPIEEVQLIVGAPGEIRVRCKGVAQSFNAVPACNPSVGLLNAASQTGNQFISYTSPPVFTYISG